jgi:DinB family protein
MSMNTNEIAQRLRNTITSSTERLLSAGDDRTGRAPAPGKWSAKQIIGHLIDSASNNHQRFVRARFTDEFIFPGYQQDEWVAAQDYANANWRSLVTLWREFNLHVARVIEQTPRSVAEAKRTRHNLHQLAMKPFDEKQPATLVWFMEDYVDHIDHHLKQIWTVLA